MKITNSQKNCPGKILLESCYMKDEMNHAFIKDPRSKGLNPTTKFVGHLMTAILDYSKQRDISKMTLDDVFEYCYKMQEGAI